MDIRHEKSLEDLKQIHSDYFSLGYLNTDINAKFALISLVCYLVQVIKTKKSNISHYKVIKQIIKEDIPDSFCRSFSVICEDFAYGCTQFPTFGIEDKKIPAKIREILLTWIPF